MAILTWTEPARHALREIHEYIARDSAIYADRVIERIMASVERLTDFPASGRVVPESSDRSLREVIAGSYRIMYRLHSGEPVRVSILAVIHGRQRCSPQMLPEEEPDD